MSTVLTLAYCLLLRFFTFSSNSYLHDFGYVRSNFWLFEPKFIMTVVILIIFLSSFAVYDSKSLLQVFNILFAYLVSLPLTVLADFLPNFDETNFIWTTLFFGLVHLIMAIVDITASKLRIRPEIQRNISFNRPRILYILFGISLILVLLVLFFYRDYVSYSNLFLLEDVRRIQFRKENMTILLYLYSLSIYVFLPTLLYSSLFIRVNLFYKFVIVSIILNLILGFYSIAGDAITFLTCSLPLGFLCLTRIPFLRSVSLSSKLALLLNATIILLFHVSLKLELGEFMFRRIFLDPAFMHGLYTAFWFTSAKDSFFGNLDLMKLFFEDTEIMTKVASLYLSEWSTPNVSFVGLSLTSNGLSGLIFVTFIVAIILAFLDVGIRSINVYFKFIIAYYAIETSFETTFLNRGYVFLVILTFIAFLRKVLKK